MLFFRNNKSNWITMDAKDLVTIYVSSTKGTVDIPNKKEQILLVDLINSAKSLRVRNVQKPKEADNFHFFISSTIYTLFIVPTPAPGILYANVYKRGADSYSNQVHIESMALWDNLRSYSDIEPLLESEQQLKIHINEIISNDEEIQTTYFCDMDYKDIEASIYTHTLDKETYEFFTRFDTGLIGKVKENHILRVCHTLDDDPLDGWYPNQTFPGISFKENRVFFLQKKTNGNHRIGGSHPQGFTKPTCPDLKTPFQYIGTIDGLDPKFDWLGLNKLHIVFPVNECMSALFLDYSDPNSPTVIDMVDHSDAWFKTTGHVGEVQYSEVNYEVSEDINSVDNDSLNRVNVCGVPFWYQAPRLRRCPKTGHFMRFVCSIRSDFENKVLNPAIVYPEKKYPDTYLCFGDAGHLYLFFCAESRVLYATWQW